MSSTHDSLNPFSEIVMWLFTQRSHSWSGNENENFGVDIRRRVRLSKRAFDFGGRFGHSGSSSKLVPGRTQVAVVMQPGLLLVLLVLMLMLVVVLRSLIGS
ncbi:hypothetical protein VTL71DRAFT_16082 [Oculimacula yallundae]|uniref:Uncharacterized protein n=1 Tax=Oculimacula yallundae TaxID=86028 RepID=A0ABR4CFP6_9HELO